MFLAFVCWIVLGLLIGHVASKLAPLGNDDAKLGVAAGGIGALLGGIIFTLMSEAPSTAFNGWSLAAAATGAALAAVGWYGFRAYTSRA